MKPKRLGLSKSYFALFLRTRFLGRPPNAPLRFAARDFALDFTLPPNDPSATAAGCLSVNCVLVMDMRLNKYPSASHPSKKLLHILSAWLFSSHMSNTLSNPKASAGQTAQRVMTLDGPARPAMRCMECRRIVRRVLFVSNRGVCEQCAK